MFEQPKQPSVKSDQPWLRGERRIAERRQASDFPHRAFRLKLAAQVSGTGVYDYDLATRTSYWSPEMKALAGLPENARELTLEEMAGIACPEDGERFLRDVQASLDPKGNGHLEGEYRIVRPNGDLCWVNVRGQTFFAGEAHERRALGASGCVVDITRQKLIEEALRAGEEKYRGLVDNMMEGFMLGEPILDASGQAVDHLILAVNEAFYAQTGLPKGVEGRRLREVFREVERSWIDRYAAVARTGKPDRFEDYNASTRRHYEVYTYCPSPGRWATLGRDITEQKRTEQALKDKERRLAVALEASGSSVYETDVATGKLHGEDRFFTMLGYASGELTSIADWWNLVHPDDREVSSNEFNDLIHGRRDRHSSEERVRAKDGSWHWILSQLTVAERDAEGQALRLIGTHTDITERKRAEEALRENREMLALALKAGRSGTFDWNPQTDENHWSDELLDLYGLKREEFGGNHAAWLAQLHPDDRAATDALARQSLQSGELVMDFRIRRHDTGEIRWMHCRAQVFYDASGKPRRQLGINVDITEIKQAEQEIRASEALFHSTFEQLAVGLAHVSREGMMLRVNAKFADIVGYEPRELEHMSFQEITHPDDLKKDLDKLAELLAGSISGYTMEKRYIRKDKTVIWCHLTVSLVRTAAGEPDYFVGVVKDIQVRKEAEDALRQSEERFRATFEHAPLGIAECSVDGRIVAANSKLADMLGYTKEELAHLTIRELSHPSDVEDAPSSHALAAGEIDSYVIEKRYLRKDRSLVWVNETASLAAIYGKPPYIVLAVEDITARKRVEEDLKRAMETSYHQATHDMLTGLANRAAFHERLREALAYAKRDGHLVAIHLLDLDRFKSINDTFGHHTGDLLLKEVARRIKSHVRATDLAARVGGDEFMLIQTYLAEPAAAGILAGKLVETLGRTYFLEQQEVQSGTSIGIAVFPEDAENPEDLIGHADLAMYEAKHRGRFNYQFYRQELGAAFLEAQRLRQELEAALQDKQFCLHYQPQFDVKSGRIAGMEALLRWRHPTRGILPAAAFIQDAERARLMPSIGEWALQTACRQHKEWMNAGLAVPVTLNLSWMQLLDPRLLETLHRSLAETGLPASMLQLEMRESVLWDPRFPKDLLHRLKACGLRLALDDFGTEMTTLPTLDRYPLDAVKPGKKLVGELPLHQPEAAMLAAIIDVAHHLNIAVCADGVETDGQLAAVKGQGCDFAQGYLLSVPLDADGMKQRIDVELAH